PRVTRRRRSRSVLRAEATCSARFARSWSRMNFEFSEQDENFRKEVRAWLERNLPDDLKGTSFAASRGNREEFVRLRAWQNKMCEAGYVGMDWPREFGGRGATL